MHKYKVNSAIQLILTGHPRHIHANTYTHTHRDKTTTNRMRSIYPSFDSFMFIWFIRSAVRTVAHSFVCSLVWPFVSFCCVRINIANDRMPYVSSCANAIDPYVPMLALQCITYISYALLSLSLSQWLMCEVLLLLLLLLCLFGSVSLLSALSWRSSSSSLSHQLTNILLYVRARSIARLHARSRLNRVSVVFSLIYYYFFIAAAAAAALLSLDVYFLPLPFSCVHYNDPSSLFNWFGSLVGVRLVPFRWSFFSFFTSSSLYLCLLLSVLILHTIYILHYYNTYDIFPLWLVVIIIARYVCSLFGFFLCACRCRCRFFIHLFCCVYESRVRSCRFCFVHNTVHTPYVLHVYFIHKYHTYNNSLTYSVSLSFLILSVRSIYSICSLCCAMLCVYALLQCVYTCLSVRCNAFW